MSARVFKLNGGAGDTEAVSVAVAALKRGELVVIPTETVYGLVADAAAPGVAECIYDAKQRERGKPLQLLISDVKVIGSMGFNLNAVEQRLADKFWPGGLTMIVTHAGRSEGFRVPDSVIARKIAAGVGGALRATSANLSGESAALTAMDAAECLGDSVSVILDGGTVAGGVASSVVRVSADGVIEVLRDGAISKADLVKVA